uniref:Uncharacterized protein n=1 Tax=Romanomermis culicivorax TaxID=13658 RepID=A0A915JLN9_ROMCU
MREEYLPKMERIAYLQGALSNYDLQHFDLQNEGDKIFGIVQLAVGEQTVSFHVIHSNDETSDAAQIANQVPLSETEEHAFAIVSIEDGQFAIRALASNQHYLNTDNVISQCEERRKKRNMASICHSYDEKWSSEAEE